MITATSIIMITTMIIIMIISFCNLQRYAKIIYIPKIQKY